MIYKNFAFWIFGSKQGPRACLLDGVVELLIFKQLMTLEFTA